MQDDEGNVLKEEKINLLKNDEFVRLINSIVIAGSFRVSLFIDLGFP